MRLFRRLTFLLALVVFSALASAQQRIPHAQDRPPGPPSSPQEALKKMTVPEGFTVELVASEPMLVNPVAMTFDERGRVWVTESLEYPRREPGPGKDRVKVLEDTDQDGAMDQVSVFLDGLNIPSGIAVGYGGVWVANAPDILFVQDTDGDGKADKQEVVVTGFGRDDTHELPNSLTWGPDGWLYGLNGVFNRGHIKYPESSPQYKQDHPGWPITCALFRIHPRTREFQVFAEGTSNPWGVAFDTEGSAFLSACVIDHLWHLVQTGYYHRQGGPYPPFTWKIESIVKHKHQKAAYCGIHFFDSDAYPEVYREKLYMGNIHGGCVNVDKLQRNGSTYFATGEPDFLTANDAWFMPVVQKTGPDGCLWVLDWYDQYHCYQDANRDPAGIERAKGRLYRVRYQDSPRAPKFDLTKETDDELITRLGSPNVFFRDLAQRVLAERATPGVRSKLEAVVLDDKTPKKARMHALWARLGAAELGWEFHQNLLSHKDPALRAWGVRAAGSVPGTQTMASRISALAEDTSRDVLLQVAIAQQTVSYAHVMFPHRHQIPMLLKVLEAGGDDVLIPHIVWQNLHPFLDQHSDTFISVLQMKDLEKSPNLKKLLPRISDRILGTPQIPAEVVASLFKTLATKDAKITSAFLASLANRVQTGELKGERLEGLKSAFAPVLAPMLNPDVVHPLHDDALLLAISWKDPAGLERARLAFSIDGMMQPFRLRSLDALVSAGDTEVLKHVPAALRQKEFIPQIATMSAAEFHGRVLDSLSRLDSPKVAETVLGVYADLGPEVQPKAVELLTQRTSWAKQLLKKIGDKGIPAEVLNQTQVRKLLETKDAELKELIAARWGTIRSDRNPAREKIIAEMRTLIRSTPGDAFRGIEVHKKLCGQCHKIYGEGQEVGPDITLNGRSSFEQLLSNVFDPSLVIGASYQGRTVLTKQGRVLSGLLAEDSPQRIVLKVQGGKQEIIPREDVEEFKVSEVSLMPEDVEKTLKPQEIADLFAFLTLDRPPTDPKARQLPGVKEIQPRSSVDPAQFPFLVGEIAPGFTTTAVGEGGVALLKEYRGRPTVVRTHPIDMKTPCVLTGSFAIPSGKKTRLQLSVGHHQPNGDKAADWKLTVKADGQTLFDDIVGPKTAKDGWLDLSLDLSRLAGKTVKLELVNAPTDWYYEFAYWGRVDVISE